MDRKCAMMKLQQLAHDGFRVWLAMTALLVLMRLATMYQLGRMNSAAAACHSCELQ
jgi:hypothetical protein